MMTTEKVPKNPTQDIHKILHSLSAFAVPNLSIRDGAFIRAIANDHVVRDRTVEIATSASGDRYLGARRMRFSCLRNATTPGEQIKDQHY